MGNGQSGSIVLASGSLAAPAACGTYSFSLANAIANVMISVQSPPVQSTVVNATVSVTAGSFTVNALPAADLNADCTIDAVDAELIVAVLLGSVTDQDVISWADLNHDGQLNGLDIQAFVNAALTQ